MKVRAVQGSENLWDAPDDVRAQWRRNAKNAGRRAPGRKPKASRARKRKNGQWANQSLKRAGFATYSEYMGSAAWKSKRDALLKQHNRECHCCGGYAVSAHHVHYRTLGYEQPGDIVPICAWCHAAVHKLARSRTRLSIEQATDKVRRHRRGQIV